ncbi:MAG TPA: DUF3048 domain-containing protein [Acidimicrobiia bacterium]|nr:DUF3048 domain-containing protein [Acidimicrobiia bacterium]
MSSVLGSVAAVILLLGSVLPPGGTFLDDDHLPGEGSIEALAGAGLTNGCRTDLFCPQGRVTRGEMATFIGRALGLTPEPSIPLFTDLEPDAFYTGFVNALAGQNVIAGEIDGSFRPNRPMSRAEMAALLDRALQLSPAESPSGFDDVDPADWFAPHVEAIKEAGITTGCAANLYCPSAPVTREEMAIFLTRAFSLSIPTIPVRTSPLDGLPAPGGLAVNRRVIGVKIDNAAPARPQSGIEKADAVIELMVEGGLSRMMALYLESDTDFLGPVRSVRPTDALVEALGVTVGISGGQPWIADMLATEGVPFIRESQVKPPIMFRIADRPAPHNLYTATAELRAEADRRGYANAPPPDLFRWGPFQYPEAGAAAHIDVSWSDPVSTIWDWDGERYLRSSGSVPHLWRDRQGATGRITADNLIVIFGRYYEVSAPTGTGRVPAMRTIGSGRAVLFTQGRVIDGIWSRPDNETWFTFSTGNGELVVPPGLSWIHVIPHDRPLSWQ